jgi:hypothetical protein
MEELLQQNQTAQFVRLLTTGTRNILFTSGCQCLKKLTNLTLAHKLGAGHLSNNYQAFGNLHPAHPKKEKAVLLIILMKAPDGECSERVLELI